MTNYAGVIELLSGHQSQAGQWADEYQFWLAEALFQSGNFQQAVEEGNDPPAQSVQEFQQLLSTRSARILIYNQQTVSALTERMRQRAQAAGVPVVGVRETMPPGSHVQDWMLQTITAVEEALSKTT